MFDRPDWDWNQRLDFIVDTMKEMSVQTDPQAMVRAYAARMSEYLPTDRMIAVSRRGLQSPKFKITRCSLWEEEVNPWTEPNKLPVLEGGILGDALYAGTPILIDDLAVAQSDPAASYLDGMRSMVATPFYEHGQAINMVFAMRAAPAAFSREQFPSWVWGTSLFGRATGTLVLASELKSAYNAIDYELKVVADIQRSLLPSELPRIPRVDLAAHYQTSQRAGGDYYDFFPLPDGKWGIFIADVSGHGTPAAVMMAITHSIAHAHPGPPLPPRKLLQHLNDRLYARYTSQGGVFVTAFYAILDPATLSLTYTSAGHPAPRIRNCEAGGVSELPDVAAFPLGITHEVSYEDFTFSLRPGDQLVFYTDGITEAQDGRGNMFGTERLDAAIRQCRPDARAIIDTVLHAVADMTEGRPADDDRTILVVKLLED